ncbi:MAG: DUF1178 family protein [Alphaproteobacteria bacterium]|nr:DUF1178 family protein [Alphaproteobacteria bacterium]
MIVFGLKCQKGHGFESWFKDGASFDRQAKRGLVECPVCGSTKVKKALMAPRLSGTKKVKKSAVATAPTAMGSDPALAKAAELHRELAKLRDHVEKNFEHVGDKFAEEARKIHYGEKQRRDIYGEATNEEAQALAEEGVEVARIPWVRNGDA